MSVSLRRRGNGAEEAGEGRGARGSGAPLISSSGAAILCVPLLAILALLLPGAAGAEIEIAGSAADDLGAHLEAQGWVRFGVHAPGADRVELLVYDDPAATEPEEVVAMRRDGADWRINIRGGSVGPGLLYMFRADGPNELSREDLHGRFFNLRHVFGDPYATLTQNVSQSRVFTGTPFVDADVPFYAGGGKSIVHDPAGDPVPGHVEVEPEDLIVYELHVQDYTARLQSLAPGLRGTYLGLAEPGLTTPGGLAAGLDHLVDLGVTAVELMPVMEYDEETGNAPGRLNHWGYMTTNFFSPEARYASAEGQQVLELKTLIRALHDRGIAVFMDVVYNHTAEGQPWIQDGRVALKCYGLTCSALEETFRPTGDGLHFRNDTGTGNDIDFSGGERWTKRLVRDSLAYWYSANGIDGFRFDLARILADGSADAADWVDNDPRFAGAHLHAEPWDNGGVWWDFMDNYGWSAANNRWAKWSGGFRDNVRRFSASALRDPEVLKRLIEGRGHSDGSAVSTRPWRSVNIIAVHDGYTLRDCTWFNDAGGSHNCWDSEGDEDLRLRREKLMMGTLLTSLGVPLILQGDEFGRSKSGAAGQPEAHNTYNYESTTGDASIDHVSWIDWGLKDGTPDREAAPGAPDYGPELFAWTRDLIALRKAWSHFRRGDFPSYVVGRPDDSAGANDGGYTYSWEGPPAGEPSQLAVIWWGIPGEPDLMVVYNESWEALAVDNLADWSRGDWRVIARSDLHADTCPVDAWQTCPAAGDRIEIAGRSMAVLASTND